MFKKIASLLLVAAVVFAFSGTPAFAHAPLTSDGDVNTATHTSAPGPTGENEAQPNRNLKAGIQKLVADAKAGKGVSVTGPQNQPRQSNGLSKGAKIAIGVGIAITVLVVIAVVTKRNSPGSISPF